MIMLEAVMTYDPNNKYRPVDSGDSYGGWVVGGLIAIAIVIGIIFWGAWGTDNGTTHTAATSPAQTTGSGSPSVPARPMATPPATPAPSGTAK
jgi:hypothetical protein